MTAAAAVFPVASGRSRANQRLGVALLVLMALGPLPLGGHRPILWTLAAVAIGLVGLVYAVSLMRCERTLRIGPGALAVEGVLIGLAIAWMGVQTIPLAWPAIAGGVPAAAGLSAAPGATLLAVLQWLTFALLFVIAAQVGADPTRARRTLASLFAIVTAYAVLGLVSLTLLDDTLLGIPKWAYQGSATASFVNRNSYATFLALGLCLGTALAVRRLVGPAHLRDRFVETAPIAIGIAVILVALLASQSRMGVFAGLCGAATVAVLAMIRRPPSVRALLAGVGLLAGLSIAALAVFGTPLLERVIGLGGAFSERNELHRQVWTMIAARPWTGHGANAFEVVFPLFHTAALDPTVIWNSPHSSYLTLWSELGLVAGSLPLLALGLVGGRIVLALFGDRQGQTVFLAACGVLVVGAVHSTVDFSLEIQAVAHLFIVILGLAVGAAIGGGRQAMAAAPSSIGRSRRRWGATEW